MEGAGGFAGVAAEGVTVFEADGADREVEAEAEAGGQFDLAAAEFGELGGEAAGFS